MATDLEKARKIVSKRERWIGQTGALPENVARAVAALGRREGLELAVTILTEHIGRSTDPQR